MSEARAEAARGATWRRESILATTDHKRIGRAQIVVALVLLMVAGAASLAVMAQAATGEVETFEALWSLHDALVGVFVVLPLWLGLASVVVPLQIGSTGLAFPRLQALSLWTLVGGAALVLFGYATSPAPLANRSVLSALPNPPIGGADTQAADLVTLGMALAALATLFGAVNLVVTVASRRTPGLTFGRLPYFAWSVLVGGIGVTLATPVFLAGLMTVWIDQHFGGSLFTSESGTVLWTHAVWLGGRPEAFLGFVFALGAASDIVATATGRALSADKPVRAGIAALATVAFVAWAGGGRAAESVLAPFVHPVTLLPVLVIGAVVLTWLGQFRHGVKAHPALLVVGAALVLGVIAAANAGLRFLSDVEPGTGWGRASLTLVSVAIPVVVAAAALVHWSPKLSGRRLALGGGGLIALALVGGFGLLEASAAFLGADGAPQYSASGFTDDGHKTLAVVGCVGVVLIALAVVRLLASLASQKAGTETSDPYGSGLTLEWLTASPPAAHNFDTVPEVRSSTPLIDARSGGSA